MPDVTLDEIKELYRQFMQTQGAQGDRATQYGQDVGGAFGAAAQPYQPSTMSKVAGYGGLLAAGLAAGGVGGRGARPMLGLLAGAGSGYARGQEERFGTERDRMLQNQLGQLGTQYGADMTALGAQGEMLETGIGAYDAEQKRMAEEERLRLEAERWEEKNKLDWYKARTARQRMKMSRGTTRDPRPIYDTANKLFQSQLGDATGDAANYIQTAFPDVLGGIRGIKEPSLDFIQGKYDAGLYGTTDTTETEIPGSGWPGFWGMNWGPDYETEFTPDPELGRYLGEAQAVRGDSANIVDSYVRRHLGQQRPTETMSIDRPVVLPPPTNEADIDAAIKKLLKEMGYVQ